MKNLEIAGIFNEIADMLEMAGENRFRIQAYSRAAQSLEALSEDLEEMARRDQLREIPGIGQDLASKIKEFLATGRVEAYEKIKKETPQVLLDMIAIPGIGPKTAKRLFEELDIRDIEDLEKKARSHKISGLAGMKEKTEENILKGIDFLKKNKGKILLPVALSAAEAVIGRLEKLKEVERVSYAGSLRRMKETERDIDILVISASPSKVADAFTSLPEVKEVLAHGVTRSSIITKDDLQVDLRVMERGHFGAAMVYFTGSKAHNIRLRKLAIAKGLKVSEYGVFKNKGAKRIAGKTEEDVYKALGMAYVPPEMREDTGEVEAALRGSLPDLVKLKDIKGDFHVHSDWSDGVSTLGEMASAAKAKGYEYVVITDHSKSLKIANGLSVKRRWEQIEKIRKLNKTLKGIELLAGVEVDIADDGSLDYSDDILKELDLVIAAIHSGFTQSRDKLTRRTVAAMNNKYVNMIAHPTGRLLGTRQGYEIDIEEVLKAALDTNTAIEVNSNPERLDLADINCRRAKELGVRIALTTDAHITDSLDYMFYGVSVARRGWLEKKDVLNCLSWSKVKKSLKQ
ncbi:MAG: DNA polymerase/3'-5' exonuclease PolX [Candidatus Omnitrophota bacterium]